MSEELRMLEARVLTALPTAEDFIRFETVGLAARDFQYYGQLFTYIAEMVKEHRTLPSLRDLSNIFNLPAGLRRNAQQFNLLLDQFHRIVLIRKIQETSSAVVSRYGDDPKVLLDHMLTELSKLQPGGGHERSVTDADFGERLKRYAAELQLQREYLGGMVRGIPTGLSHFDSSARVGWLPGELVSVIGRTHIGKSWFLLYFGLVAWTLGYKILLISPEMPADEVDARFDVLLAGRMGISVQLDDLYRGFVPGDAFRGMEKVIGDRSDWLTETSAQGKPFTVFEVEKLIDRFHPDLVLVDGIMLMRAGRGSEKLWEKIAELSYDFKNLAVAKQVPIVVSHQANREAHNTGKPPQLHEVYGGDALAQACDRVLVIWQRPNAEDQRKFEMRVGVPKYRKGRPHAKGMLFDFTPGEGKIREIPDRDRGAARDLGYQGSEDQQWQGDGDIVPLP